VILFLDFDGVLHPDFARGPALFSARPLLWQLLDACPHIEVVFSTSWREIHPVDELIGYVTSGGGERHARRFIGTTPRIVTERGANIAQCYLREAEINLWLLGNGQKDRPWIALDDFTEYFSPACPNLVAIDHVTGLKPEHLEGLIARCQRYIVTEEDGQFVALCLDVDVASDGPTEAEAVANLREALALYFQRDEL
jgi:hypothetical protein